LRFLIAALSLASPALADEPVPLKQGQGLDVVTASCVTCDTLNYIPMNSVFLTQDAWKAEVTKMITAFGAPRGGQDHHRLFVGDLRGATQAIAGNVLHRVSGQRHVSYVAPS
jgi:hypothetical protein